MNIRNAITWPRRAAAPLAALLVCAGCASFDPNNVIGRQFAMPSQVAPVPASTGTLSREQRAEAFDFVWHTINDRYYDAKLNGVDWKAVGQRFRGPALDAPDDESFWDELDRMAGELKDAHTRVESPKRVKARKNDESVTLGLNLALIDGALVVTGVNSNSDAWWAGIRPGMLVTAIDGVPAMTAYRRFYDNARNSSSPRARHQAAIGLLNRGAQDSRAALTLQRADGTTLEANLTRKRIATPPIVQSRRLPSGYGYIRFTNFLSQITPEVVKAVAEHKDAPGLVIDLRGNGGGALSVTRTLLDYMFQEKTLLTRQITRDGKPISVGWGLLDVIRLEYITSPKPEAFTGPVVVLINEASGSGSEYFASTMQALGRATIMGRTSCGCLLGFLGYASIPGGGELAYSEVGFITPNGKRIEGDGVVPDKEVPLTISDLQFGRDRTLEEAQVMLTADVAKRKLAASPR